MRIVAGKYKGHVIHAPKSIPARPTTDRAKESLFNILQNRVPLEGISVLDLFSGTGNMAYEFASRGAATILAIDQDHTAVKFINDSFRQLGFEGGKAQKANVFSYLKRPIQAFDIVFADPPYAIPGILGLAEQVFNGGHLLPGGLFILEHAVKTEPGKAGLTERRVYGQSAFSFYEKSATFEP